MAATSPPQQPAAWPPLSVSHYYYCLIFRDRKLPQSPLSLGQKTTRCKVQGCLPVCKVARSSPGQLGSTDVCLNGTMGQFQHGAFSLLNTLHSHILSSTVFTGINSSTCGWGKSVQTFGSNSTELAQVKCTYFLLIIFCGILGVTLLKMLQMFC